MENTTTFQMLKVNISISSFLTMMGRLAIGILPGMSKIINWDKKMDLL